MNTIAKHCLNCERALKGRIDKKFCDDSCRNNYNNQQKSIDTNYMRNVVNALRKNRKILHDCIPASEEFYKIRQERLIEMGFQLKYHTHVYKNKKGDVYYFCFDYGYLLLDHDWYLIVSRKES